VNLSQKIRYLQLLNHVLFLVGLVYVYVTGQYYLLGLSVATLLTISVLGINIGFHRYLTHKSFTTNAVIDKILLFCGTLCLVGTPLTWSISHINHHAYPDKEGDPYSPHRLTLWNYLMARFEPVKHARLGMKQLLSNKSVMFFHDNYLKVIAAYCIVLALINPWYVIFFWAIPAFLALYLILITNILCHLKGYRNFDTDDKSTNNILISIITLGEGWHNNHHANPSSWNTKQQWWEFDPTATIIRLIKNG
jgi:stearoyl-CoA desaturase (delta-9 desaturase)